MQLIEMKKALSDFMYYVKSLGEYNTDQRYLKKFGYWKSVGLYLAARIVFALIFMAFVLTFAAIVFGPTLITLLTENVWWMLYYPFAFIIWILLKVHKIKS